SARTPQIARVLANAGRAELVVTPSVPIVGFPRVSAAGCEPMAMGRWLAPMACADGMLAGRGRISERITSVKTKHPACVDRLERWALRLLPKSPGSAKRAATLAINRHETTFAMRYLITGATGFIGGYIAQACLGRGRQVVTIARANSNTAELEKKGVVVHRGDVTERETVRRAMEEVEVVIHCAAKVGHWGPLADFRAVNVEGLRNLLD